MKTLLTVTAFAGVLVTAGALAAPPFETLDADKDSFINKEEASAWKPLPHVFDTLDVDEDEKLSYDEYSFVLGNECAPASRMKEGCDEQGSASP